MSAICMTRAIKNLRYIEHAAAHTFSKKDLEEISALRPEVLLKLGTIQPHLIHNTKLAHFLRNNPIPLPKASVSGPLFNGTLVFARITFNRTNQPSLFSATNADIQMAITYATLAVIPIHAYALQYGLNSVNVSQNIVPHDVDLIGNTFSDDLLKPLTDAIIRENNLRDSCVIFLADPNCPRNTTQPGDIGYHHVTDNGNPFCFCRVGQNLTIADPNNQYAGILSHEIAEMVVDPKLDGSNPEVCDACFNNCGNNQFNFFDNDTKFIRGSNVFPPQFSYHFFIDGIVKPGDIDPHSPESCVLPGKNARDACVYAPPTVWSGPGLLTTTPNIVSVSGHYSSGDQRDIVIACTSGGKIHEIFWKSGQAGIEGEDDLPVAFTSGSIVGASGFYNSNDQRHIVVVGTTSGTVHEIFWKADTAGIEGQDDLPVTFGSGNIAAVSGFYNSDDQRHIVAVGTKAGKIHEIFWKSDTVGIEGHDDLPVSFDPNTIVAVSGFYNRDERRHFVIVGTTLGRIHEIFWKSDTVGVEGHDDLPVTFDPNTIKGIAGFYNPSDQRHVVIVGTTSGNVHQIYWKTFTVGVEIHSVIAKFPPNSIVGVGAFYSDDDQFEHVIVGTADGKIRELWTRSGQVMA
jgi:hypothetical protein